MTKGEIPDNIYIPVGDGVIISGIHKGFKELLELGWINKLPKLIGVQAEGSNAVSNYFRTSQFLFRNANTIADSIRAGATRNLFMAAFAVRDSGGTFIEVSDQLMIESQRQIAEKFGLLAEPSAASSYAGLLKYRNSFTNNNSDTDLLLITGNGLKDSHSLSMGIKTPVARKYENWKDLLLNEK
jgi:threonine synthase